MDAQEIFNQAYEYYSGVTNILGEFGDILEKATDGKFTTDIALFEFDCILQFILLHCAIADNRISRVELQFIEQITDRGDIMALLRDRTDFIWSWKDLENMNYDLGAKLLNFMTPVYDDLLKNFCNSVAKADGMIKEIDLFDAINKPIIAIFAKFSSIDGNSTDAERDLVCDAYIELFVKYYKEAVKAGENL